MKGKKSIIAVSLLLISAFSFQSCIGSFSLTNKVLTWNKNVNNKFVNEVVFFAFWVLPVYEVTAIADLLVINSIEFWSGNNPMEANNKVISTDEGNYYIASNEDGYNVISPNGDKINFLFDKESQTWSLSINDNDQREFLKFIDDSRIQVINNDGNFVDVELTREGVDKYITSMGVPMMAMK